MSVKSVQFTVAAHIMAALGYKYGEERACAFSATDHAARHLPRQCCPTGVCDSLLSCGKEVCRQLPPQGVHVGVAFSGSEQLREIARKNNLGSSGWSDPGKDALTFFDWNCAHKKNNRSGEPREC